MVTDRQHEMSLRIDNAIKKLNALQKQQITHDKKRNKQKSKCPPVLFKKLVLQRVIGVNGNRHFGSFHGHHIQATHHGLALSAHQIVEVLQKKKKKRNE